MSSSSLAIINGLRRRIGRGAGVHRCSSSVIVQNVTRQTSSPVYNPSTETKTELVDNLLSYTSTLVNPSSSNVIAFSGGVDSSLAAYLVHRVAKDTGGEAMAILGISPAVPPDQITLARRVSTSIGIPLTEVRTREGGDSTYIKNDGEACLACKTHLYTAMTAVIHHASYLPTPILFNGTNKDDLADASRVGLIAAHRFHVHSPLLQITKREVRTAAKHLGLPNWDYAAAPCLRSRLAFGVHATRRHLNMVREAEAFVRKKLELPHTANLRVRMLARNRAVIELDSEVLETFDYDHGIEEYVASLGFTGGVSVRAFRSGSLVKKNNRRMVEDRLNKEDSYTEEPMEAQSQLVA